MQEVFFLILLIFHFVLQLNNQDNLHFKTFKTLPVKIYLEDAVS